MIENPKAVFGKETGKSLAEGLSVHIIEDANVVKLVLPKIPKTVDLREELSEDAVENVAGSSKKYVSIFA